MKIYFAGSIRGGRDDADFYNGIINHLKKHGQVLTEHIGNKSLSKKGEKRPMSYVYNRDMNWISGCDLFVAEIAQPSIGVGYEIACAERLNKPVLCLYRKNKDGSPSGMVEGNKNVKLKYYFDIPSVDQAIKQFVRSHSSKIVQ
jgi:hypothetical protein